MCLRYGTEAPLALADQDLIYSIPIPEMNVKASPIQALTQMSNV